MDWSDLRLSGFDPILNFIKSLTAEAETPERTCIHLGLSRALRFHLHHGRRILAVRVYDGALFTDYHLHSSQRVFVEPDEELFRFCRTKADPE